MNLVAFLDGELADDALGQKLEEKVAQSVSVRKEVQALEKTWGMLDWLPRPELPADFASQTVTRIHSQQLRAEMIEGQFKYWTLVLAKVIGWAACVAALVTAGFASVRFALPDPTRDLINHLEIVENLETYSAIPDLKFLDDISRINMFRDPDAPLAETPAADAAAGVAPATTGPGGQPATPAPM
jgi:hypothetical protein